MIIYCSYISPSSSCGRKAEQLGIDIHCESSDRRTGLRVTLVDFRLGVEVVVVGSGACTGSLLGAAMEGGASLSIKSSIASK